MFEARHQMGFDLEAADEFGVVGVFRQDHLDGNFSANRRLFGAVHNPKASFAKRGLIPSANARPEIPFSYCLTVLSGKVKLIIESYKFQSRKITANYSISSIPSRLIYSSPQLVFSPTDSYISIIKKKFDINLQKLVGDNTNMGSVKKQQRKWDYLTHQRYLLKMASEYRCFHKRLHC